MLRKLIVLFVAMITSTTVAHASELGVSFNDISAQVSLRSQVGSYDSGRSIFSVRGLYNEDRDTSLVSASFDVLGPIANTGLEIGAGVNGYYADTKATGTSESDNILAGGIGAIVRFTPPGLERLNFSGRLYYCPEIFTGLDGEKLVETEARASFEISPNSTAFVNYNVVKADIENKGSRTLDKTFRVGVVIGF
jgi:hypothetical protein